MADLSGRSRRSPRSAGAAVVWKGKGDRNMELKHIELSQLSVSPANMRGVAQKPDLTNILPSVRARGILVPLIVRPDGAEDAYEIVAGKRRYHAALNVAQESGCIDHLPGAVMEAGDEAAALEATPRSEGRRGGK